MPAVVALPGHRRCSFAFVAAMRQPNRRLAARGSWPANRRGCGPDHVGDDVGLRDHDHVRALGLGDRGASALGHGADHVGAGALSGEASTVQDGSDFQAGGPDGSENASSATGRWLRLLSALRFGGPARLRDLSGELGVIARNVTGLVDALQGDGLVERLPQPSDRRATLVRLTGRGSAWRASCWPPSGSPWPSCWLSSSRPTSPPAAGLGVAARRADLTPER